MSKEFSFEKATENGGRCIAVYSDGSEHSARIVCIDAAGNYPIVATVLHADHRCEMSGFYNSSGVSRDCRLKNIPYQQDVYLITYKFNSDIRNNLNTITLLNEEAFNKNKAGLESNDDVTIIGCKKVTITDGDTID